MIARKPESPSEPTERHEPKAEPTGAFEKASGAFEPRKVVGYIFGALALIATRMHMLPMPGESAEIGRPYGFRYNLATGWYVFIGFCTGYILAAMLIYAFHSQPSRSGSTSLWRQLTYPLRIPAVFAIVYIMLMTGSYFLPYAEYSYTPALGESASDLLNARTAANAIELLCMIAMSVACWTRGTFIGRPWLVAFPILATAYDFAAYTLEVFWLPFTPTVLHALALALGVWERRHQPS